MKWERGGRYFWRGEAGYTVSVAYLREAARFSAWGPNLPPEVPNPRQPSYGSRANLLGVFPSVQAAKAACESHLRGEA